MLPPLFESHNMTSFRAEAPALLRLAAPLMLAQIAQVGVVFTDTLIAGQLSTEAIAAVGLGGSIWSTLLLLHLGTMLAISAFVSQYDGSGRLSRVGYFLGQCLYLGITLAGLQFIAARATPWLLPHIGISPELSAEVASYLRPLAWGSFPLAIMLLFRFSLEGLSQPRVPMLVAVGGLLINIPLDFLLMLPPYGFGVAGAGAATAIVVSLQALALGMWGMHKVQITRPVLAAPNWRFLLQILAVGLPIGISFVIESGLFSAAALLVGRFGAEAAAAHQIAFNVAALAFMLPLGISLALTIRVGNAVGALRGIEAQSRGRTGVRLVVAVQAVSATAIIVLADSIARLYTEDPGIIQLSASLLLITALFQLQDGAQVAFASALRGYKDTRIPLLIVAISFWVIAFPCCLIFGEFLGWGTKGVWLGMLIGLTCCAILMAWRFVAVSRAFARSRQ